MRYNGGKSSIGKEIASIIGPCNVYVEPFCGMLGVGRHIYADRRIFYDSEPSVVALLNALRDGWEPPDRLSEDDYRTIKSCGVQDAMYAFAAFGCSYAGKKWGGYARSAGRNYASNAANSLRRLRKLLKPNDKYEIVSDYADAKIPHGSVVYCDPPYNNTTSINSGKFDSTRFYSWAEELHERGHTVFVSEYSAPASWCNVWSKKLADGLRAKAGHATVECLFRVEAERS